MSAYLAYSSSNVWGEVRSFALVFSVRTKFCETNYILIKELLQLKNTRRPQTSHVQSIFSIQIVFSFFFSIFNSWLSFKAVTVLQFLSLCSSITFIRQSAFLFNFLFIYLSFCLSYILNSSIALNSSPFVHHLLHNNPHHSVYVSHVDSRLCHFCYVTSYIY